MANLPPKVRDQVRAELAKRFDAVRWEELDSSSASEWYERFIKDPKIGGALAPFMAAGSIRVWIKDGPAKEYRRALEGVGYMAQYTARCYPGADTVVKSALGQEWWARLASVEEKPMRCMAERAGGSSVVVIWGPLSSLQALVWHAVLVRAGSPHQRVCICLTKPSSAPLDTDDWAQAQRVAEIVGAECSQVTYSVTRKQSKTCTDMVGTALPSSGEATSVT